MSARSTTTWLGCAAIAVALALAAPARPTHAQQQQPPPAQLPALAQQLPDVLILGDSLAVGTMPYLDALLADVNLTWDVVNGRTTPGGLQALRQALREIEPQAVVVSLGTNDGPDPDRFRRRLRLMMRDLAPDTCVIWPTIVRPPRKGQYNGLNRALRAEASHDHRLIVLDWDGWVRRGQIHLRDGLHADAPGYRYRSQKIAEAVHAGCPAV
jgi:lysophospholipase L1-like esterase